MIHVLLTVKPSLRYPGKNRKLWPFTYKWLLAEAGDTIEPVRLYVVGSADELPAPLPPAVRYLNILTGSHARDVEEAEAQIAPSATDVMVLAQLTQPLRERGLLHRAVDACRRSGRATVTATPEETHAWRELDGNGSWRPQVAVDAPLLDGALYAWPRGRSCDIFDPRAPHTVVERRRIRLIVDVDEAADVPPALAAAWAELMTE